jgi:hypothetical protein
MCRTAVCTGCVGLASHDFLFMDDQGEGEMETGHVTQMKQTRSLEIKLLVCFTN